MLDVNRIVPTEDCGFAGEETIDPVVRSASHKRHCRELRSKSNVRQSIRLLHSRIQYNNFFAVNESRGGRELSIGMNCLPRPLISDSDRSCLVVRMKMKNPVKRNISSCETILFMTRSEMRTEKKISISNKNASDIYRKILTNSRILFSQTNLTYKHYSSTDAFIDFN